MDLLRKWLIKNNVNQDLTEAYVDLANLCMKKTSFNSEGNSTVKIKEFYWRGDKMALMIEGNQKNVLEILYHHS